MPRARRRKDSTFQTSMTKSIFLHGDPNRQKLLVLDRIQDLFLKMVNQDIQMLSSNPDIVLQLVKNDKKDSAMRSLEKLMRINGLNSAFCQNAFDIAVTHLSNRLDNIRLELLSEGIELFAKSKVLFAMSVMGRSRADMVDIMRSIKQEFHQKCASELEQMTTEEFNHLQQEFTDRYIYRSMEYKIPELKSVSVPLDSRLMRLEKSANTTFPYVILITDPEKPRSRIAVPLNTSAHSLHKINSNTMAGTVMMKIRNGKLRISWSYDTKRVQPKTLNKVGVDTGITDSFHTSDDRSIGSMAEILDFYHKEVEPAFAEISDLRNKKSKISYYLRHHDLPEDVRRSLIQKMDRLEKMIRTADAPYRKKRHYYEKLDHEIKQSVADYMDSISKDTLTVIEKLDIKEFKKSKSVNSMFSTFARGKLQSKLMKTLNWKGYDYIEVVPDFTSQLCPVCNHLTPENRHHKEFTCTCCGYTGDADHVASINIRDRADDAEILNLCEQYKYDHQGLQNSMKIVYMGRHDKYLNTASA